jgi:hypothetical protein
MSGPLLSESRKIGDYTYTVTKFTGMEGMDLLFHLTGLSLPALMQAWGSGGKADVMSLLPNAAYLYDQLKGGEFVKLAKRLLQSTTVNTGTKVGPVLGEFESLMQGRPFDAFKLLGFVIEWNFAEGFRAFAAELGAKAANASSSAGLTT